MNKMYIVTGAAGFIGSCVAADLQRDGIVPLVLVDDFSKVAKSANWSNLEAAEFVERVELSSWLSKNASKVAAIIHLGARTDTVEKDSEIFQQLNVSYSKMIWNYCVDFQIPLIYASSAATYGAGEHGFNDDHDQVPLLKPLNPYGESKQFFDTWVLQQVKTPPFWVGLKFFNVFGPNEYHKGRMGSVIMHAFNQIQATGELKLFRSHHPDFKDGGQLRDFVYVKDLIKVIRFLLHSKPDSGIYNLGTGTARTFNDLGKAVFDALKLPLKIQYIDTPLDIRDTYQYFTEANMEKLTRAGYQDGFVSLEEAVADYVQNYLQAHRYYSL